MAVWASFIIGSWKGGISAIGPAVELAFRAAVATDQQFAGKFTGVREEQFLSFGGRASRKQQTTTTGPAKQRTTKHL
jgi:hypothetical protein